MKLQDLFPQGSAKLLLANPRTITLFEELVDRLAAMEGHSTQQRWLLSQAQALTADIGSTVAFDRAGRARNPGASVAGGLVLAVPAFREFRPVRTP